MQDELPDNFATLMWASEIIITAIVFIGVYFIFKPLAKKNKIENKENND